MKKLLSLFDNYTLYKTACVCVFMLIPSFFLCFFPQIVSIVMLAWGAVMLLRDLVHNRNFARQTGSILLTLFCVGYAVTLVLYAENDLVSTLHVFCWMILEFFLLFALEHGKIRTTEDALSELYVINRGISIVALVSGIISLVIFFMKVCVIMPDPEGLNAFWSMGVVNGRNTGVFNNAIPCANAMFVGIAASLFNICHPKSRGWRKVYYAVVAFVAVLCMLTTVTRTYTYGAYFLFFVASFVGGYQFILRKYGASFVKIAAVFLFSICVCATFILTTNVAKSVAVSSISGIEMKPVILNEEGFDNHNNSDSEDDAETIIEDEEALREEIAAQFGLSGEITLDREELDRLPSFLFPRDELWKVAIEVIPNSPVFGFTSGNRSSTSLEYGTSEYFIENWTTGIPTYHNAYFDIAVSAGLLGLILMLLFIAVHVVRVLKLIFTKVITVEKVSSLFCIGVLMAYLACHVFVTSMFFGVLCFSNVSVCLYFWVLLGFASKIYDIETEKRGTLSLQKVIDKLMRNKVAKKER